MEDSRPWLDMAHVISCLNKLDAGIPDKVCLMSRDEQNVLVVSYAELKQCLEQSFNECIHVSRHRVIQCCGWNGVKLRHSLNANLYTLFSRHPALGSRSNNCSIITDIVGITHAIQGIEATEKSRTRKENDGKKEPFYTNEETANQDPN